MSKVFSKRDIIGSVAAIVLITLLVVALVLAEPRDSRVDPEELGIENMVSQGAKTTTTDSLSLSPFDPNTVEYEELRAMGIGRKEAVSLIKYRASGKVFRIPEDVALCYAISDSLYGILKPFIAIGDEYRIKPRVEESKPQQRDTTRLRSTGKVKTIELSPFRIDTVSVGYLRATWLFTKRQAEAVIRWRDGSGFRDMEELRDCYVIDEEVATALEPYVIFPEPKVTKRIEPVEINSADSATLRSIMGVGQKSVVAIMRYRELLGGYNSVEQLKELSVITDENYLRIRAQVWCDSTKVRRMNINSVSADTLTMHPYVTYRMLRKLLNHRSRGKQWGSLEELVRAKIITEDEAQRLAPYLVFDLPEDKK